MLRFFLVFSVSSLRFYFYIILCVFFLLVVFFGCEIDTRAKFRSKCIECERDICANCQNMNNVIFVLVNRNCNQRHTAIERKKGREKKKTQAKKVFIAYQCRNEYQFDKAS